MENCDNNIKTKLEVPEDGPNVNVLGHNGSMKTNIENWQNSPSSYHIHSIIKQEVDEDVKEDYVLQEVKEELFENDCIQQKEMTIKEEVMSNKTIKCSNCGYTCTTRSQLCLHRRSHRPTHHCNYCNFHTTRETLLTYHMRMHTGEMLYSCTICDYKCATVGDLSKHMRIHKNTQTLKRQLSCMYCDFTCYEQIKFSQHMLLHTSGIPFFCTCCDYMCNGKQKLIEHLNKHTEKPFQCNFCNFKSDQQADTIGHLESHLQLNISNFRTYEKLRMKKIRHALQNGENSKWFKKFCVETGLLPQTDETDDEDVTEETEQIMTE